MTKRIFTIIAVLFFTYPVVAQKASAPLRLGQDTLSKVTAGVKAGVSADQITGRLSFKNQSNIGISGGGFIQVERKKIGVQLEGLISLSKYSLQDSFISGGSFSIIHFDIPILFECKVAHGLWIQAGPQLNTILAVSHTPSTDTDPKSLFQSSNFCLAGGLEVKLPWNLSIGARYVYGLQNINDQGNSRIAGSIEQSNQAWRTSSIQGYVGLKFL